jgi:hypothetical protein
MKKTILALLVSFSALSFADPIIQGSCADNNVGLADLYGKPTDYVREFANGNIKVFKIDKIEPAGCGYGLAITLSNPEDEAFGSNKCVYIGCIFSVAPLNKIEPKYDAVKGLRLTFKYANYDDMEADGDYKHTRSLKIRVNQQTGAVTQE